MAPRLDGPGSGGLRELRVDRGPGVLRFTGSQTAGDGATGLTDRLNLGVAPSRRPAPGLPGPLSVAEVGVSGNVAETAADRLAGVRGDVWPEDPGVAAPEELRPRRKARARPAAGGGVEGVRVARGGRIRASRVWGEGRADDAGNGQHSAWRASPYDHGCSIPLFGSVLQPCLCQKSSPQGSGSFFI